MLFTSLTFLVFFSIVVLVYWIIPQQAGWGWLLVSSLFFYGWYHPAYIGLLAFSVLVNYTFGRLIEGSEDKGRKRKLLISGVIINILLLGGFKYAVPLYGLLAHTSGNNGNCGSVFSKLLVPLGISFFTFSNISYLIEVKRMRMTAERHLGHFANFVVFFPKLLQGPIERPGTFLAQLRQGKDFDYSRVTGGMRLMVWGFFKKLVIADRLAVVVNSVYGHPYQSSGPLLILATVFYAFQIYMDFSAYTDIARGAAAMLGFNLSLNFNRPYSSKSVKEFWTRWHMTLSSWLRDYVFLPSAYFLSGKMKKEKYAGLSTENLVYSAAIILTFFICGIWHGLGWNFIIWGELFAVFLITERYTHKARIRIFRDFGLAGMPRIYKSLQVAVTFFLVTLTWVFFRSDDTREAIFILRRIFCFVTETTAITGLNLTGGYILCRGFTRTDLVVILLGIPMASLIEYGFYEKALWAKFGSLPWPARWLVYYVFIFIILGFGMFESGSFIYFKF
jgi:D-alanyl-lipoteichoic acid acyltransferase DltB (MBOAT superfamily)